MRPGPVKGMIRWGLALGWLGLLPLAAGGAPRDPGAVVRLERARAAGDREALWALAGDPQAPEPVRARALLAACRGLRAPLGRNTRARIARALESPSPRVRQAAVRAVGRSGARLLERAVLERLADPDPEVRAEVLDAVEPWTRLGHLYYLERALGDPDPGVRARAVRNLGVLDARDLRPDLYRRVRDTVGDGTWAERDAALRALARWGRLDLAAVRDVLSDPGSSEPVLLTALSLCRDLPPSAERDALVLDQIRRSRGFRVAWAAFRLLREGAGPQERVGAEVARFLAGLPDRHAGARAMAAYLVSLGYRVEYAAGAWRVGARGRQR